MSRFINVTAKQVSCDASSATYECTVSKVGVCYFGLCDYNRCLAIKKAGGYSNYWGFPEKGSWKSSWGTPSWVLSSQSSANNQFGNLQGSLKSSITWREPVPIDRGNSRQGSKTIEVGVHSGSKVESDFGTTVAKITLTTTKIADASNSWLKATVDPATSDVRNITVEGGFTNPEGYYTMKLYRNGVEVPFDGTYVEKITEDKYLSTIYYELKIYGKDGTHYTSLTKKTQAYIDPSGPGVFVTKNNDAKSVHNMYFKNVNHKEITEVWIKKNGKVYKTEK
jgi:hypothetical protein